MEIQHIAAVFVLCFDPFEQHIFFLEIGELWYSFIDEEGRFFVFQSDLRESIMCCFDNVVAADAED